MGNAQPGAQDLVSRNGARIRTQKRKVARDLVAAKRNMDGCRERMLAAAKDNDFGLLRTCSRQFVTYQRHHQGLNTALGNIEGAEAKLKIISSREAMLEIVRGLTETMQSIYAINDPQQVGETFEAYSRETLAAEMAGEMMDTAMAEGADDGGLEAEEDRAIASVLREAGVHMDGAAEEDLHDKLRRLSEQRLP